jgi:hypothetical protein
MLKSKSEKKNIKKLNKQYIVYMMKETTKSLTSKSTKTKNTIIKKQKKNLLQI